MSEQTLGEQIQAQLAKVIAARREIAKVTDSLFAIQTEMMELQYQIYEQAKQLEAEENAT